MAFLFLGACASYVRPIDNIRDIVNYQGNIRLDSALKPDCFNSTIDYVGVLGNGKAGFEYCYYIYKDSGELVRIKYSHHNNGEIKSEGNFYYKDGDLIYVEEMNNELFLDENLIRVYIKEGKAINKSKSKSKRKWRTELIEKGIELFRNYKVNF
ncbi:hypothetical protein [Flagellimonas amoyensis]|uniref:hypothetical protein n=1 Tax=Flagellimonas amoyensis TaxID=2169401 RepID=UPI000D35986D|nr:hypothetical protein [Allomuricauda amoyensis]